MSERVSERKARSRRRRGERSWQRRRDTVSPKEGKRETRVEDILISSSLPLPLSRLYPPSPTPHRLMRRVG